MPLNIKLLDYETSHSLCKLKLVRTLHYEYLHSWCYRSMESSQYTRLKLSLTTVVMLILTGNTISLLLVQYNVTTIRSRT